MLRAGGAGATDWTLGVFLQWTPNVRYSPSSELAGLLANNDRLSSMRSTVLVPHHQSRALGAIFCPKAGMPTVDRTIIAMILMIVSVIPSRSTKQLGLSPLQLLDLR